MLNPWLSLSLNTAQLALKLTRIMTGVVPNSTGSSRIIESEDRADPQVRDATEVQAPVPEVQERPMAAAAHHSARKTTESPVRKMGSRTKVGHAPKPTAQSQAAAKQAVPKLSASKRAAKRTAAAALACSKATRRSAVKKK
jgi:hypothetical protein